MSLDEVDHCCCLHQQQQHCPYLLLLFLVLSLNANNCGN